jgi:HD-GYP domain-containing protein (c-di-GMP phosphodiesterase class II)
MEIIKEHCGVGFRILKNIDFPWPVAKAVLQHHERLDGSGYPQGLAEDEITIEARVLSVADTIESMLSDRPYRRGLSVQRVERELESHSGTTLDADAVLVGLDFLREKRKALGALSGKEIRSQAILKIWASR